MGDKEIPEVCSILKRKSSDAKELPLTQPADHHHHHHHHHHQLHQHHHHHCPRAEIQKSGKDEEEEEEEDNNINEQEGEERGEGAGLRRQSVTFTTGSSNEPSLDRRKLQRTPTPFHEILLNEVEKTPETAAGESELHGRVGGEEEDEPPMMMTAGGAGAAIRPSAIRKM